MRLLLLLIGVVTWHATSSNAMQSGGSSLSSFGCGWLWHCSSGHSNELSSLTPISRSSNTFGTRLFKQIIAAEPSENVICSPLSAFIALSMVTHGAHGETRSQLSSALDWHGKATKVEHAMKSLIDFHNSFSKVELTMANKIFLTSQYSPKREFSQIIKNFYHSEAESVQFQNNIEMSKTINEWIADKTNYHIRGIADPDDLDENSAMVIVSTIYFNGKWLDKFNVRKTRELTFHTDNWNHKKLPTMHRSGMYEYGDLPQLDAKFVRLPYEYDYPQHALSMFIILPNEREGLAELERNLDENVFERLFDGRKVKVDLYLPKFRVESNIDLKVPLTGMGLGDIFTEYADFSGINERVNLKIDKISQAIFIEVNESDTEAAAETSGGVGASFHPDSPHEVQFKVDHPFLYVVMSHHTKTVLFQGHITF